MRGYSYLFLLAWCAAPCPVLQAWGGEDEDFTFFENKIRPLLIARCYECHSADSNPVQGGLWVDSRDGLRQGGDTGPAIVPGDLEASLLIEAVRYDSDNVQMPPIGKLPDEEIRLLEQWVAAGAPDPRQGSTKSTRTIDIATSRNYWAFQPLSRPALPAGLNEKEGGSASASAAIDAFIRERLASVGIEPNPPAERRKWIRRVYLDLIGLPPTAEEIEAFERDKANDAYERVVDHLLASPHYGERWGRHWLDLARFAESHGFEHDYDRPHAYHYRDFVIQALNQDLPYDTFVRWQIAGDEIDPENPLALQATGFLAAGVHATQITASQVEKERYDELDDIVSTIGTSMLGLTVGCARCHDHKFDPIPMADYYRLVSTFTTTVRSDYPVDVDPQGYREAKQRHEAELSAIREERRAHERDQLAPGSASYLASSGRPRESAKERGAWIAIHPSKLESAGGANFRIDGPDLGISVEGHLADKDTYTITWETSLTLIQAIRLEALADSRLPAGGPGRASNGNFQLTHITMTAEPLDGSAPATTIKWGEVQSSFDQSERLSAHKSLEGQRDAGWAVDPRFGQDHAATFAFAEPLPITRPARLTLRLVFEGNNQHSLGRFRVAFWSSTEPPDRNAQQIPELAALALDRWGLPYDFWFDAADPEWNRLVTQELELLASIPRSRKVTMLISSEGVPAVRLHTQGGDFLEKTHVLRRGDPNQKLEEIDPGYLQVLCREPSSAQDPLEERWRERPPKDWRTSYHRRSLANWIVDTEHGAGGLLARVFANRLWQHHFGRGLVATPSDFGSQGTPPSHPELLEWLATDLVENGWQIKRMHRAMLLSDTYRQDSRITDDRLERDPDNALVSRFSPRRLEAEILRDAMLWVSGLLDATPFGPGTLDPNQRRRSIYFTVKRSQLVPFLQLFDAPDANQGLALRATTTVAPQALALMNHPQVRECAEALAKRAEGAVDLAYRLALGRDPTDAEREAVTAFLAERSPQGQDEARRLAFADFCQVLLQLNEFAYVD